MEEGCAHESATRSGAVMVDGPDTRSGAAIWQVPSCGSNSVPTPSCFARLQINSTSAISWAVIALDLHTPYFTGHVSAWQLPRRQRNGEIAGPRHAADFVVHVDLRAADQYIIR